MVTGFVRERERGKCIPIFTGFLLEDIASGVKGEVSLTFVVRLNGRRKGRRRRGQEEKGLRKNKSQGSRHKCELKGGEGAAAAAGQVLEGLFKAIM